MFAYGYSDWEYKFLGYFEDKEPTKDEINNVADQLSDYYSYSDKYRKIEFEVVDENYLDLAYLNKELIDHEQSLKRMEKRIAFLRAAIQKKWRVKMNDWIYIEKKIPLTKHKWFDIQIGWEKIISIFSLDLGWSIRQDHAGFKLNFNILWFYFIFYTYDSRHWCSKCNAWETSECREKNHDGWDDDKLDGHPVG
jgi:hypothetical protein